MELLPFTVNLVVCQMVTSDSTENDQCLRSVKNLLNNL